MGPIVAARAILMCNYTGESANAVPQYQKLRTRVTHIRGNRRGQPNRSSMERPDPGGTAFRITVFPVQGKYALSAFRTYPIISIHSIVWCVKVL